jgi:hypothetical protein
VTTRESTRVTTRESTRVTTRESTRVTTRESTRTIWTEWGKYADEDEVNVIYQDKKVIFDNFYTFLFFYFLRGALNLGTLFHCPSS